ncbi:MAG: winged helix-turn-helix transcriptional regulator [Candidatus Lokiarchaeota archaeon]|nr:winged helix-turn-helix transcriptional regulator [Candidatus Lokiarchaeota archaeon]
MSLKKAQKLLPELTKSYFYKVKKEWRRKNKEDNEKRNFSREILNHLLINPSGATITDIAKDINISRITVSKYISVLEAKEKVTTKQVGAYTLYYSADRSLIPKKIMLAYYSGLLASLKREIADKEKYKEFGKTIADYIQFAYTFTFPENKNLRKGPDYSYFFKNIRKILSYIDFVYENRPKIKVEALKNTAHFLISNIDLFKKSKELDYHYYIASGVIEKLGSNFLEKDIICNVEDIDLDAKIVKLKIVIKE